MKAEEAKTLAPEFDSPDCCVDCGKAVSPTQASLARQQTQLSRAFGDSRNRQGFVLCRTHLDRETRAFVSREAWP